MKKSFKERKTQRHKDRNLILTGGIASTKKFRGIFQCRNDKLAYFIFFMVTFVFFYKMIVSSGIPLYIDMTFPLTAKEFIRTYTSAWFYSSSSSFIEGVSRSFLMSPFLLLTYLSPWAYPFLLKVFFFLPFFLNLVFFYLFLSCYSPKSRFLKIVFTLIYGFNPWIFNHSWGIFMLWGFISIPLGLYFIKKYIDKPGRFPFWGLALSSILSASSPHTFIYFNLVIIFFICTSPFHFKTKKINIVAAVARFLSSVLLINAFWIAPYAYMIFSTGRTVPEYSLNNSLLAALSNANDPLSLLLFIAGWGIPGITITPFILWSRIIFLLSTLLLVVSQKKDRIFIFWSVSSISVLILATGARLFPDFYNFLAFSFAPTKIFAFVLRAPDRFFYFVLVGWMFLTFRGTAKTWEKVSTKFYFVLVCLSFVFFSTPVTIFFRDKVFNPTYLPKDYQTVLKLVGNSREVHYYPPMSTGGYFASFDGKKRIGPAFSYSLTNTVSADDFLKRHIDYYFYRELLKKGKTVNLGHFLNLFYDSKYLVYDKSVRSEPFFTDQSGQIEANLGKQKDLKLVFEGKDLNVYEIGNISGKNNLIIFGGLENILYLDDLPEFDQYSTVIFSDQQKGLSTDILKLSKVVSGKINEDDLVFPFLPDKYFYSPKNFITNGDPKKGWFKHVYPDEDEERMKRHGILNHDFDFGLGNIFSYYPSKFTFPVQSDTGSNLIFIRYLPNKNAENLNVFLNGKLIKTIVTNENNNDFRWETAGQFFLKNKKNNIEIESSSGMEIVNSIVVIPEKEYGRVKKIVFNNIKDMALFKDFKRARNDESLGIYTYLHRPGSIYMSDAESRQTLDLASLKISTLSNSAEWSKQNRTISGKYKENYGNLVLQLNFDPEKKYIDYDGLMLRWKNSGKIKNELSAVYHPRNLKGAWPFMDKDLATTNSDGIISRYFSFPDGIKSGDIDQVHIWINGNKNQNFSLELESLELIRKGQEVNFPAFSSLSGDFNVKIGISSDKAGVGNLKIDNSIYYFNYSEGKNLINIPVGIKRGFHTYVFMFSTPVGLNSVSVSSPNNKIVNDKVSIEAYKERYDPGWVSNSAGGEHFICFGYANCFYPFRSAGYTYVPDKMFLYGIIISIFSMGGYFMLYLIKEKKGNFKTKSMK